MELHDTINGWLDECPTDVEIIEEFDNSVWVKVSHPWSDENE
mgnify:FL=1|tara:strand:+ start:60 stop:185 length:126 start_codon:yes stop_codon:yes gene_type:complete